MEEGTIRKATGGFYYVTCSVGTDDVIECRARGLFRRQGIKPLVGDRVRIRRNEDSSGYVEEILPRRNSLVRPPLANLDYMVAVVSATDPAPNLLVLDKFLAVLEHVEIEPLIAITKSDLAPAEELAAVYRGAGFAVFITDPAGRGTEELTARLAEGFSAFSGNSGVGKTSLLNAIDSRLGLTTGVTSKKLGRGRHTTRTVETYRLPNGGLVADTPGFTSLELIMMSDVSRENLAACFREFTDYAGRCKFLDCAHTCEKGCAVLEALEAGKIAPSRHRSYRLLYDEIKDVPQWQRR